MYGRDLDELIKITVKLDTSERDRLHALIMPYIQFVRDIKELNYPTIEAAENKSAEILSGIFC